MKRLMLLTMLIVGIFLFGKVIDGNKKNRDLESNDNRLIGNNIKGSDKGITFQGYITDINGNELNGDLVINFVLWNDSIGGEILWEKDSVRVQVIGGVLKEIIEVPYSIFYNERDVYIGLEIDGEEMGRVRVTSVPFSYISIRSDTSSISMNTKSINGRYISDKEPVIGDVLKWDGSEWTPKAESLVGWNTDYFLNNNIDTFNLLVGDLIEVNRGILKDIFLGDSVLWVNKISTDPQMRFKASNYIFYDKQYPDRIVNIYDGYIKQTGSLYTKGIVDSGNLRVTGMSNEFNYGITLGYRWRENPDPFNDSLYNMSGLKVLHGNSEFYDDVALIGDTLSNNQAYLSLLNVRDSFFIQIRPKNLQGMYYRKYKSTNSRDTDSMYVCLDREGLKITEYIKNHSQDTTTKILDGYGYFKDSVKIGDGEVVTKFIRVGTHAGIVFGGKDTFWLSKDTI